MSQRNTTAHPIIGPALKVGAMTGCAGFLTGGIVAVLRSTPTVMLFAFGTGFNCCALGSTFWAIRSTMLRALHDPGARSPEISPKEMTYISGVSGSLTGLMLGLILRGRSNMFPGGIVWGLIGFGGQYGYNIADDRHRRDNIKSHAENRESCDISSSLVEGVFRSKWSPIKKLTDEEYETMLKGKLLAIEAEIAITIEEINKLEEKKLEEKKLEEKMFKTAGKDI